MRGATVWNPVFGPCSGSGFWEGRDGRGGGFRSPIFVVSDGYRERQKSREMRGMLCEKRGRDLCREDDLSCLFAGLLLRLLKGGRGIVSQHPRWRDFSTSSHFTGADRQSLGWCALHAGRHGSGALAARRRQHLSFVFLSSTSSEYISFFFPHLIIEQPARCLDLLHRLIIHLSPVGRAGAFFRK